MCLKFNEIFFSVKSTVNHFVSEYSLIIINQALVAQFSCQSLSIILTSFISSQKSVKNFMSCSEIK